MFDGIFTSDVWHRDVKSIAQRNAIRRRRWGMRTTVYLGIDAGDYVLTYNKASTNLQDNNNWLLVSLIGQVWGDTDIDLFPVSIVAGTLTLDFANSKQRRFINTTVISAGFTVAIPPATSGNALIQTLNLLITGSVPVTFPSAFVMQQDDLQWNNATKILTLAGGTATPFEMSATKEHGLWELKATTKYYAS